MKRLLLVGILFTGCSTLPALPNVKTYSGCDPIYEEHIPTAVEINDQNTKLLTKNPKLVDAILPSNKTIDALGKNGIQIGKGTGEIISAFKDNLTPSAVISAAAVASVGALTDARSEDRTQKRLSVCLPHHKNIHFLKGTGEKKVEFIITDEKLKDGQGNPPMSLDVQ